jgi:glycosyltransferase involved in cell wall biosynthesis
MSRVIECLVLARQFGGQSPLIVFGDLPLRCNCRQTLFLHNALLIDSSAGKLGEIHPKYILARKVFNANLRFVDSIIVQSELMLVSLENKYPITAGKIKVVPNPVPNWFLKSAIKRKARLGSLKDKLRLFYPASNHPHKNHRLLSLIKDSESWPVSELTLTIDGNVNPAPSVSWISCCGLLDPKEVGEKYASVDAVLILSVKESYGFPLFESMLVGLPIVCPDLPYARHVCGDQAIYFDPYDHFSLKGAIRELATRLSSGWWPVWDNRVTGLPGSWNDVAKQFIKIACD